MPESTESKHTIEEAGAASAGQPHKPSSAPGAHAPGKDGRHSDEGGATASPADEQPGADGAAELEGDLDELAAVAAQRDEYLALAQRAQADFENYRKRVARESALAKERGVATLTKEMLPALDNLDRAIGDIGTAAEGSGRDDPLLDGVRLVRAELSGALARVGVEAFSPLGEVFDPAVHEAMATVEQPADGAASGTVVEVYQPGYRLGESIIRPARVVVAA